ncbi:MAG: hypothetical protein GXO83_04195 [Chlorobi bacterium]|nr:hypothetical protein [Chlorobiota bacterium]
MEIEKQIELIRTQIGKLDAPDFDLEAWKNTSILILSRIFGQTSLIVSKIQSLSHHLSSWALRDTLGKTSGEEQVKRNAREMLETVILEIETLGPPVQESGKETSPVMEAIRKALENELKVSQYRTLQEILSGPYRDDERLGKVHDFLAPFDAETLRKILAALLADKAVATGIKQT